MPVWGHIRRRIGVEARAAGVLGAAMASLVLQDLSELGALIECAVGESMTLWSAGGTLLRAAAAQRWKHVP